VSLAVLPLFHVTGMQNGMNGTLYVGATVVLLPRWDRDAAAQLCPALPRHRHADDRDHGGGLLSNPRLGEYDLSSICRLSGGGAAMPEAVATRLKELLPARLHRRLWHVRDDCRPRTSTRPSGP
jgi:fatty-acyl-CoA synthase